MPLHTLTPTFKLPDGVTHRLLDPYAWTRSSNGEEFWKSGAGKCDCARSRELKDAGLIAETLPCGKTIELVSCKVEPLIQGA
jgi:hypothetical protein